MEVGSWPERTICMQRHRGDEAQRYRDYAAIGPRYKLHRPEGEEEDELYDLEDDPAEERDISGEHPGIVASMRHEYEGWFNDVSATRPDNYAPPRIVIGTEHENPTGLTRQDWRLYGGEGGWNADNPGYWLVKIAAEGIYSLRIETEMLAGMENATLHFKCGGLHIERRITSGDRNEFAFEMVELEGGAHTLEAYIELEGEKKGVSRVIIGQRSQTRKAVDIA